GMGTHPIFQVVWGHTPFFKWYGDTPLRGMSPMNVPYECPQVFAYAPVTLHGDIPLQEVCPLTFFPSPWHRSLLISAVVLIINCSKSLPL
ncbi:MAG: hypothetical protein Q7I94_04915, partial [Candidatus Contubernalis sp.]|nr:hypothetical protein [Candidatus Contubernalis sp.]